MKYVWKISTIISLLVLAEAGANLTINNKMKLSKISAQPNIMKLAADNFHFWLQMLLNDIPKEFKI